MFDVQMTSFSISRPLKETILFNIIQTRQGLAIRFKMPSHSEDEHPLT